MIDGHPPNVTRRVKATINRAHKHGLIVTATTDGVHATASWHTPLAGRNRKGCAVDVGFSVRDLQRLTVEQRRAKLVAFQVAEYRYAKRFKFRTFLEILGPDNRYVLMRGERADLVEGSALETQHDSHCHIARSPLL